MTELLTNKRIVINAAGFYQHCTPDDCPIQRFVNEFGLQPKRFASARKAALENGFSIENISDESFLATCPKPRCSQDMLVELEPGRDDVFYVLKEDPHNPIID